MQRLTVKVTPKSKKTAFGDWFFRQFQPVLRVTLKAVPESGQANAALCAFLANALQLSKAEVSIVSGETSRLKILEIKGVCPKVWKAFLDGTGYP